MALANFWDFLSANIFFYPCSRKKKKGKEKEKKERKKKKEKEKKKSKKKTNKQQTNKKHFLAISQKCTFFSQ